MEILQEYRNDREGNDCWLSDYIILVKLTYDLYVVVHTNTVCGSWTGNPKTSKSEVFTEYSSAHSHMKRLIKNL